MYEDTEDELTKGMESNIGERSDKDKHSAFELALSDTTDSPFIEKDVDQVE